MTVSGFGWRDLSTDAVPAAERLEYWRDATNSLFPPTRLRRDGVEGFYGHVAWLGLGEVTIADIVSTIGPPVSRRTVPCWRRSSATCRRMT